MSLQEFQSHRTLANPESSIDTISIISVLLFIFGLSLLGSRFVFSPGITIDLPKSKILDLQPTTCVLNLGLNNVIIFNNKMLKVDQLYDFAKKFLNTKKNPQKIILLLFADKLSTFGSVTTVIDILKEAGYQKIQIACEKEK